MIQENLHWNSHIDYECNRVSRATAVLAKLKHYLPKHALLLIYNALCISHMSYAISVWGAAPSSSFKRIEKIHKKGIRHVCNAKYNAHTEPLYKKEHILKLNDLYKLQCVKIMYKKINNKLHSYHTSKLLTNFEITNKHTRKSDDIYINRIGKTLVTANSINLKVGNSWNELSSEIKNKAHNVTIATFTKDVKKNYVATYSDACVQENCYICGN